MKPISEKNKQFKRPDKRNRLMINDTSLVPMADHMTNHDGHINNTGAKTKSGTSIRSA